MAHRVKLQQPGRERVRVRDLAIELSVPWSEVLRDLRESGEYIRSELSLVEAPVAERARSHFRLPDGPGAPVLLAPRATVPEFRLDPPGRRPSAENNPFRGVLSSFPSPAASRSNVVLPNPPAAYQSETPRDDPGDYSAAGAYEASEAFRHLEWSVRGITEAERDVWLAAGLSERQGRVAAGCNAAGLGPHDLARDVSGFTVLFRITRGEDPVQVARLLRLHADESAGWPTLAADGVLRPSCPRLEHA